MVKLLLNLRKRFGNNAGVLHIKNATEYGALKPFTDSIELANDLKTFRRYHEETDPNVYQFSMAMSRLDEFIPKERDTGARTELTQIFNTKLGRFGQDPLGEARRLLDELEEQLTEFGTNRQTSGAFKGLANPKGPKSANAVKFAPSETPCIVHHKFGKCTKGKSCSRSHDRAQLRTSPPCTNGTKHEFA